MQRYKSAILVAVGLALLGAPSPSWSQAQDFDTLYQWLTEQSVGKSWKTCPINSSSESATRPYFEYNNAHLNGGMPKGSCREIGSFKWSASSTEPKGWWVQMISNLRPNSCTSGTSCVKDFIRVCSKDKVGKPQMPGPCVSLQGTGLKGCEVCATALQSPL